MISVTFAPLIPKQPSHGTGFHLDGKYAGYIGQTVNGAHFVYFTPFYWQHTRLREARGYVMVAGSTDALSLVRRLVTRLAHRQLMTRTRAIVKSPCASSFYRRVLADVTFQRRLAYALIDQRTWNDPGSALPSSDFAFTPECASPKATASILTVRRVQKALTFNLIHYFGGSTRRVTAHDIQAGAEPCPADPAFPLARVACTPFPILQADTTERALFIPTTSPSARMAGRHFAATAALTPARNTQ